MIIEGKGNVCPSPVMVEISSSDLIYARDISSKRNDHRGYSSSSSRWKRGSCKDPALIGTIGELAVQKFLALRGILCPIVSDELNDGDGGIDFEIGGHKYQVKTSRERVDPILVRRISESGKILSLACERFIFCKWKDTDTHCAILGWCHRNQLIDSPVDKSCVGRWWNLEVRATNLLSVSDLVRAIKQDISHA